MTQQRQTSLQTKTLQHKQTKQTLTRTTTATVSTIPLPNTISTQTPIIIMVDKKVQNHASCFRKGSIKYYSRSEN